MENERFLSFEEFENLVFNKNPDFSIAKISCDSTWSDRFDLTVILLHKETKTYIKVSHRVPNKRNYQREDWLEMNNDKSLWRAKRIFRKESSNVTYEEY